jgi:hypothetical protein
METPFLQLPELLKVVVTVTSAVVALLPIWSRLSLSQTERFVTAGSAAALVFLFWPVDSAACTHSRGYTLATVLLLALTAVAGVCYKAIKRSYGHVKTDRDEFDSKFVLGGPMLTRAAHDLQEREPDLTIQEIFERMGEDPNRTWKRGPRTRLSLLHRATAVATALGFLLAMIAALAYVYLAWHSVRTHRELSLSPSADQTVLARRGIAFTPTMRECKMDIEWNIDGPAEETGHSLGVITSTGNYLAPEEVTRDFDIFIVATPVQHRHEAKKVKVQLRPHPAYAKPYETPGADTAGQTADFVIEIFDTQYSWVLGGIRLEGEDGAKFVRRMAADGVFSGFEHIIAIGAASREYYTKIAEEQRAFDRANVLGSWVSAAVGTSRVGVHALKIGRYDEESPLPPELTARERRVVIVGVQRADPGVDLLSALRDAFAQKRGAEPLLGMYLDEYPFEKWELRPVRR